MSNQTFTDDRGDTCYKPIASADGTRCGELPDENLKQRAHAKHMHRSRVLAGSQKLSASGIVLLSAQTQTTGDGHVSKMSDSRSSTWTRSALFDVFAVLSAEKLHVPATPLSALVHYDGDAGANQAHSNASDPAPCLAFASGRAYWWSERVAEAGALALQRSGPVLRQSGWRPLQRSSEWRWDPAQVHTHDTSVSNLPGHAGIGLSYLSHRRCSPS